MCMIEVGRGHIRITIASDDACICMDIMDKLTASCARYIARALRDRKAELPCPP